ncbi:MAG: amidohydrolase [Bacteroidota bacterium]
MPRKLPIVIFIVAALATFFYFIYTTNREANMILINGRFYLLDTEDHVAEAVAIHGNRIIEVGTTASMLQEYKNVKVVDLQGKTVFPGFIDGHGHVLGEGGYLQNLDLVGTTSAQQIADLVAGKVHAVHTEQWIYGRGWDQNRWQKEEFPDHEILDKVSPNNPVVLRRVDGHAMWVNSKVLQIAGVTAATPDPDGGKIYRDVKGVPTGVLVDNAMNLIDKIIPELTADEIAERLKLATHECAKLGLTEVHDMGVDLQTIEIYKKLIDEGECPIRIYAAIGDATTSLDETRPGTNAWQYYLEHGKEVGYGNGMLTVRAIKLYMDGALGSRGAALLDSYSDDPGNRGLTLTHESELDSICQQALQHGFQVCVHAIGDRANHIVLNEYEKVLNSVPNKSISPRWRIEHAQILEQSDIPRFKQIGVLPSMQPTHGTSDMYWAELRLGSERIKGAYAWQSVLKTGADIIAGSDFPVESPNPLWGFYAAITRRDRTGYPQDGWRWEERMTRLQAARAFTTWAAYGSFEENTKGQIRPGQWADLTVLSKDIMQIPPEEILKTDVDMTIVGGKIVYEKPAAAPADTTANSGTQ